MNKIRLIVLQTCVAIMLVGLFGLRADAAGLEQINRVTFFDVSDLPARIDEPNLRKTERGFVLNCAVANRSGEQLIGIRLILLVVDPAGKLRSRITWNESAEMAMYSIKTLAFNPELALPPRSSDQLFLSIDEVIGRETIWRAAGVEKALRAYARGQHDLVPVVRTFVNQYDPRPGVRVIPLRLMKE